MRKIKTSEGNKNIVPAFTKKYEFKDDRTIGQIAISYSIQLNKRFNLDVDKPADSNGKEYPESLLGEINRFSNDVLYYSILNQHYGRKLSEEEATRLLKMHLDHGLEILNTDLLQNTRGKNAHIDYLLGIMNNGLSLLSNSTYTPSSSYLKHADAYSGLLEVELGKDSETLEPIVLRINDENYFDSQHFAVAGMNGSGKTELVKDILYQIRQISDQKLNFIYFDYKGEGKSDKLKSFLTATSCEFVDIKDSPFAFNPLRNINVANERDRNFGIKALRDTIASIDRRISIKQQTSLEIVLKQCFEKTTKTGKYPSFQEISSALVQYYENSNLKPDTLTSIIGELASQIFSEDFDPDYKIQDRSLYVNLPPTLGDTIRQATVFVILNYLLNEFISYDDVVASVDRIKPIRYVIVIDEAHAYLGNKNMAKVLENLLRMIRSKGVVIMLISQGVDEFKQKDFDFSSQIKIPILLNIQNKDVKLAKSFLGTPRNEGKLKQALKNLDSESDGVKHGIINTGDPLLLNINMFWERTKK